MAFPASATYAAASFMLTVFLVDGDSLTQGITVGDTHKLSVLLSSEANYAGKGQFQTIGLGGRDVATMNTDFWKSKAHRPPAGFGYLFIWGGAASTSATTFSELQTYWAAARADGWKVVAFTIMLQDESAPEQALTESINTSIRAASSEYDFLFDAASWFTNPTDPVNFSDGVHMTAAGYQGVADLINDTLNLPVL